MKTNFIFLIWISLIQVSHGQPWKPVAEVSYLNTDLLTTDQIGNIYVSDVGGSVTKFTLSGEKLLDYSPVQLARIQNISAITQIKVILFYENLQEFTILDRYLSFPANYSLGDFGLGYVEHIAPNTPLTVWVLDISDFSLKLIELRENRLIERKSLAKVLTQELADIRSFHSHQNRLYLIDKATGVQVFDNIGNYLFRLLDFAPNDPGFDKDYLYYVDEGILKFVHLYNGEGKVVELPTEEFSGIRYANDHLVAFTKEGFNIYKYLSAD